MFPILLCAELSTTCDKDPMIDLKRVLHQSMIPYDQPKIIFSLAYPYKIDLSSIMVFQYPRSDPVAAVST
jgi:hypothetical protein